MKYLIRIGHPLFCWAFFLVLGMESIRNGNFLTMVIVGLGLLGFSQTYWDLELKGKVKLVPDVISFSVGSAAAVAHFLLLGLKIFG